MNQTWTFAKPNIVQPLIAQDETTDSFNSSETTEEDTEYELI